MSLIDKLIESMMDENSLPNRMVKWVIAGAAIILTIMVIYKFTSGAW